MKAKLLVITVSMLLPVIGLVATQRFAFASILGASFESTYSGNTSLYSAAAANGVYDNDYDDFAIATDTGGFTIATVSQNGAFASAKQAASSSAWIEGGFGVDLHWQITQRPYFVPPPPVGITDVEVVGPGIATCGTTVSSTFGGLAEFKTEIAGSSAGVELIASIQQIPLTTVTTAAGNKSIAASCYFLLSISNGVTMSWDGNVFSVTDGNGFTPTSGRPASGVTDGQGKLTLSTFTTGDGAEPGEHKVTICEHYPPGKAPPMGATLPSRFPADYADPTKSPFTAKVVRGEKNEFSFEMKKPE